FAVVDAAFSQRRKALRGVLAPIAGSSQAAEAALLAAGIAPLTRGEQLTIEDFARVTQELENVRAAAPSGTLES
ncbi:MAG: 16S rRNA (adenine(1518)-N(6)/adenine(1519)-N(6))-dimethyltransferase, partial [Demequina sp.]